MKRSVTDLRFLGGWRVWLRQHWCCLLITLAGCSAKESPLPHTISIPFSHSMAVDLLFEGNERALTVFYRPENEKVGPSKDYELEVYTVDGGVTTVRIGPAYLDYFFAFIVNSETGIVSINNPVVTVDGRKMDIVEAWRKF